ncbi:MAG TPA: serine/threonine-protein kinase [Polyangiaceae bacterium]|nr:serine/threonine-protein kinase [Polyangiaceae bacterium]
MALLAERYELGSVLGSGGFATVYRAHDRRERRDVAVKIIPLPQGASETDEVERFRHEALSLSRLRSANVARVYDFGKDPEHGLYLVMELIEGPTLEPGQLGRPLLPHEVMRAARALLAGLAEAHAARLVHRDVKPANVLVPGGLAGLAKLKILDFGIARSEHREQLEAQLELPAAARRTVGTPAYMAPELLLGEPAIPASDVYAAGLVLFELLGNTLLFPERPEREQLVARTRDAPKLDGRVPSPIDVLLAKMLERDPEKRFADAQEALTSLLNMETAPVDVEALVPPPAAASSRPPASRRSVPSGSSSSRPPMGALRLTELDDNPIGALRSALHALDLPMIDALARRERGSEVARVARAIALALRLEIDAASLLLEPLKDRGDLGRGVAMCLLAPRARAATKARIHRDLEALGSDGWLDTVDVEIGGLLVAIEAALGPPQEMAQCLARCERLLARAVSPSSARSAAALAQTALASRLRGDQERGLAAFEQLRAADLSRPSPLTSILRSLLLGPLAFRADDHAARAGFERAVQLASEAGAILFEVRALVAWGGMLVEVPGRTRQGLAILERVVTLLLHGDLPSLEHVAAHNHGVGLLIEGDYARANRQFRRAREVASGEAPIEFELVSGAMEVVSHLAWGDREGARAVARLLEVARNVPIAPRETLLVAVARALARLGEHHVAEVRADLARVRAGAEGAGDATLLADALLLVCAAAAGEEVDYLARAAELDRAAEEHGFAGFYWFDALKNVMAHLPDTELRNAAGEAVDRLVVLLGSAKR